MEDNYGITPTNPLIVDSVSSSRAILEHLITNNYHLISFDRKGSIIHSNFEFPIDCYEINTRNNETLYIYIYIYNDETYWIPPSGFKFLSSQIFFVDVNSTVQKIEVEKQYVIDNNCFNYLTIECFIKRISLN